MFTQVWNPPPPPPQAIQTIGIIKSSGRRLLQLINDILDAAKMKQGELVIKHERVNVRQLMGDVFDITQTLVTKHVKLVNEVRPHGRMCAWTAAWHDRMGAWTYGRWPHVPHVCMAGLHHFLCC